MTPLDKNTLAAIARLAPEPDALERLQRLQAVAELDAELALEQLLDQRRREQLRRP